MTPKIHDALGPLLPLLGTWRGTGQGSYPTIDDFSYREEVTFGHVGKPFLAYSQKTRDAETDLPLHAETGYWRPAGDGRIEVVLSHPTGVLEMLLGSVEGGVFDLASSQVALTPTAKSVVEVRRRFEIIDEELRYEVSMAAVGLPLTHHLSAVLRRAEA